MKNKICKVMLGLTLGLALSMTEGVYTNADDQSLIKEFSYFNWNNLNQVERKEKVKELITAYSWDNGISTPQVIFTYNMDPKVHVDYDYTSDIISINETFLYNSADVIYSTAHAVRHAYQFKTSSVQCIEEDAEHYSYIKLNEFMNSVKYIREGVDY